MTTIRAVIHDGRIEFPAPPEMPDGTEVLVVLTSVEGEDSSLNDEQWDNSPEGIADWLRWLDSLEPLVLTDRERSEIEASRQARKRWEKEQFATHADQLASKWE